MNAFPMVASLKVIKSLSPKGVNLSLDLERSNVCNCFSKPAICFLHKAYHVPAKSLTV